MTIEEEKALQDRLNEAKSIKERLETCIDAIVIIKEGIFGLNASTFRDKYERVGSALRLVQSDVIELLDNHIIQLNNKYKEL